MMLGDDDDDFDEAKIREFFRFEKKKRWNSFEIVESTGKERKGEKK